MFRLEPAKTQGAARLRLVILFLLVTLGFALFRNAPFYIWDDSPGVFHAEEWAPNPSLGQLFRKVFSSPGKDGYRPLAHLGNELSFRFLFVTSGPTVLHLLLIGSIYGALAVCLVALTRRFVRLEVTAYFTVLLVLASPPLAATTWIILVGVQAVVPLLFCLALLCYWRARESSSSWFFHGCLVAIFLLAPWYREFLGLVPVLIGFLEWQRARRLTPLLICAGIGLLHALFPTAFLKLLFFPDLPLQPIFARGYLALALENQQIRWQAAAHFLPLFPPMLLILGMISALARSWERIRTCLQSCPAPRTWYYPPPAFLPAIGFTLWLVLVLILVILGFNRIVPFALCLGVALIGLQQQEHFLTFWFLATFLPILRVFTEHVHFLYAIVPASIILAGAVEAFWLRVTVQSRSARWFRLGLAGCLALVAADQAANLYGVYRVNQATYGGIAEVARLLKQRIPPGSVVVSNVIHGEEIKWHAGKHFENFWTVAAGVLDPERVVQEPDRLKALLDRSAGKNVYYLDVDFDYLPWKAGYHRHLYIHRLNMPREDLGIIHRTGARYVFIDPLRHLIPRDYVPFLGAPDLVNDFYFGRSGQLRPFTYKVAAIYHLYRAKLPGEAVRSSTIDP